MNKIEIELDKTLKSKSENVVLQLFFKESTDLKS